MRGDDKNPLQALLKAISGAKTALQLDECFDWTIRGKWGHAFDWGDGHTWGLYFEGRSPRHWYEIKKRLDFCIVTQDGDSEGVEGSAAAGAASTTEKAHRQRPAASPGADRGEPGVEL